MPTPLLTTKLYIPPVRPELVSRPCLIERLNAGLHRKLTLISAPAGFGKTTLLSEWIAGCGRRVAWLSLDEGDNDPACFLSYFVVALQTVRAGIGATALTALQSPQPPPIESALTALINEIAGIPDPFALVLDDFHVITDHQVNDALAFLLDNLPSQMHLILSGRADPPWPLARLRARGELTELRANDLRFTLKEATLFLNDVMELALSTEDIATLDARTEGWIAGLQLAALSIQGRRDVAAFIKAFRGTHRFILEYLVEEVLNRQSSTIQAFLLRTSILERMTAPLCDAVTDGGDSQSILTQLEQANLFLIPLDDERRWYRYHPLFADLLRSRLEQTRPDQVLPLHRQASHWYEENGRIVDAVSHALAAGDVGRVTHLVAGNALAIMGHGELTALVRWLDTLPEEVVLSHPWICVSHAWVLAYSGQLDVVEKRLQDVEETLDGSEEHAESQHITGHVAAIYAYLAGLRGHMSRAAELAREALARLPDRDLMARGFAMSLLGSVLRWSGDFVAAAQASAKAISISQAAGDDRVAADAFCDLAALQLMQGKLHKAATTCQEALQLVAEYVRRGGRRLPAAGFAYARMSSVLLEWNELDAALHHAREGVELCEQWGWADGLIFGYGDLASVLQAIGDGDGALDAMRKGKRVASNVSPFLNAYMAAQQARLWLAQGSVAAESRWVQKSGLRVNDEFGFQYEFMYRTMARVLIAHGKLHDALGLLARLLQVAEAAEATGSTIEILVLQAMALQAQGEEERALTALERALSLAAPEGYVRIFIDEGAPMGELLRQAAHRGIAGAYVRRLLAALEEDERRKTEPSPSPLVSRPSSSLVEPLSERESEVLRLLTTRLSAPDIAQELFISANTVRSHIKSIYGKLNVHSRHEAIARAEELNLL